MYMNSDFTSFTRDRIPQNLKWVEEGGELDCYEDSRVFDKKINKKSIALLIEPRSIQPDVYRYIEDNWKKFRYVFTHDNKLLKLLPNAKLILFGGVYGSYMEPKIGDVSIVSSNKEMCELHRIRTDIARQLENNSHVACFGTYNGGKFVDTKTAYSGYKFSIVIENYREDYWFTEKVCNAFASRTIPIYYGAKRINEFFNSLGIIQLEDPYEALYLVNHMDFNKEYLRRLPGVIANYELVKRFYCFEDWFHTEYQELLEDLINGD